MIYYQDCSHRIHLDRYHGRCFRLRPCPCCAQEHCLDCLDQSDLYHFHDRYRCCDCISGYNLNGSKLNEVHRRESSGHLELQFQHTYCYHYHQARSCHRAETPQGTPHIYYPFVHLLLWLNVGAPMNSLPTTI